MNSAIQCLSNTIPLADYFLGYDYRSEINYNSVLGTKGQLVNAYTKLMKQLWLSSNTTSVDPSFFHSALVKFAPDFYGNEQHDAQELLAFLLDGIHEDLNRVQSKPYVEDVVGDGTNNEGLAVLAWQNYLTRDRSIVVDLFQGQLLNTIVCGTCHSTKVKFEPFMYLSLPISKTTTTRTTLEDCLQLYCQVEQLSGENQWYCGKCEKHVNATKKLDLWMLPPILIIHLKRFTSTGNKIDSCIQYPLCNWNVPTKSTSTSRSATTNPNTFDLYAISHHYGGLQGGHYTATVKNRFNDDWYEMNDSQTRRVDRISNRDSRAYCLFYNRVDTSSNGKSAKIMRQSVNRPELWPHMQLNTDNVTSFRRSTIVKSMPPPPPSPTVNGGDNVQVTADMAAISEESALEA
jgi:ubiquitin carboxyl-terminal hydrolase 8